MKRYSQYEDFLSSPLSTCQIRQFCVFVFNTFQTHHHLRFPLCQFEEELALRKHRASMFYQTLEKQERVLAEEESARQQHQVSYVIFLFMAVSNLFSLHSLPLSPPPPPTPLSLFLSLS